MDLIETLVRKALQIAWPSPNGTLTSTQLAATLRGGGMDIPIASIVAACQLLEAQGLLQGSIDAAGAFIVTAVNPSLLPIVSDERRYSALSSG